tara:strand:- start:149 stop:481 length:333 start_codon:yes stop_codon:yes gene_type:complete
MNKILPIILVFAVTLIFSDPAHAWIFTKWTAYNTTHTGIGVYIVHGIVGAIMGTVFSLSCLLKDNLSIFSALFQIVIFILLLKFMFEGFIMFGVIIYILVAASAVNAFDS